MLDFTKLNSEASDLHLMVAPSHEFQGIPGT
jgi:hypothetical protein